MPELRCANPPLRSIDRDHPVGSERLCASRLKDAFAWCNPASIDHGLRHIVDGLATRETGACRDLRPPARISLGPQDNLIESPTPRRARKGRLLAIASARAYDGELDLIDVW